MNKEENSMIIKLFLLSESERQSLMTQIKSRFSSLWVNHFYTGIIMTWLY